MSAAPPPKPSIPLRALQIVVVAILGGLVAFTAVALALDLRGDEGDPRLGRTFLFLVAGIGLASLPAYLALRGAVLRRVRGDAEEALAQLRAGLVPARLSTLTIVGAALTEGVGLLAVVGYFVTGHLPVVVASGVCAVLLLFQIPGRGRLEALVRETKKPSY